MAPCILGDWNIDLLPALPNDPFAAETHRKDHHLEQRSCLARWIKAHKKHRLLKLFPEGQLHGNGPGGKFKEVVKHSPITRLPDGQQLGLPACIDYALTASLFPALLQRAWDPMSDHAIIAVCGSLPQLKAATERTRWFPQSEDYQQTVACFRAALQQRGPLVDWRDLVHFLQETQKNFTADSCVAKRRQDRMPEDLRELYTALANSTDEGARSILKNACWERRKEWVQSLRATRDEEMVSKGRIISKSKKLHRIKALSNADSTSTSADTESVTRAIREEYESRWRCMDSDGRAKLVNWLRENDGEVLLF